MKEQDKRFFEALSNDRADSAKTLEKPSMRGVKKASLINIQIRLTLYMSYFRMRTMLELHMCDLF